MEGSLKDKVMKIEKIDLFVTFLFTLLLALSLYLVIGRHFYSLDFTRFITPDWFKIFLGVIFVILATLVCFFNCYLTFIAPLIYKIKYKGTQEFESISGLPVIGTIFIVISALLLPISIYLGYYFIFLLLIDANGMFWIVSYIAIENFKKLFNN